MGAKIQNVFHSIIIIVTKKTFIFIIIRFTLQNVLSLCFISIITNINTNNMRKIIVLIIAIFTISIANAQKNFPLPSDNPFWTEVHGSLWTCSTSGIHGICNGYYCQCTMPVYYKTDTVINSITYNRLYSRGVCQGVYPSGPPPEGCPFSFNYQNPETLFATIRQDTLIKTIFILDNNTEIVLYNFKDIIVGNDYPKTYNNSQNDTLVVVALDSLLLDNTYVKKWDLAIKHNGVISDSAFVSIIDGIGSTFGILANLTPSFENTDYLSCFSINNIVLYPDSTYDCDKTVNIKEYLFNQQISIYPNPTKDNLTIETNNINTQQRLEIVNLIGQTVYTSNINSKKAIINTSAFANGLYILKLSSDKETVVRKFVKE